MTADALADRVIGHVAILVAMRDEARGIIDALDLEEVSEVFNDRLPMRCFRGRWRELHISLAIAGVDSRFDVDHVGCEPAAVMAYEVIRTLAPDVLISAGTAGGFAARGATIGTVYLSAREFVFHDRHVPLAGFDESAIGGYPAARVETMAAALALPTGVISSGSSLAKSDQDIQVIARHGAVAKEMEAAAIAWIAMMFGVPMIAVKSITNLVDEDNASEEEFVRHFALAEASLRHELLRVLDYLVGKRIDEL